MDPNLIVLIVGLTGLVIERIFSWALKIKHSNCFGIEIEREPSISPRIRPHIRPPVKRPIIRNLRRSI